jgi:hypothetical protein
MAPAPGRAGREEIPLPKIKALRWWMIGLLMSGAIVNDFARSSLAVPMPAEVPA